MTGKTLFISVIFLVFSCYNLLPDTGVNLTGVRPPFFILKLESDHFKLIDPRVIYSGNGINIGEYRLISGSGKELLCKCINPAVNISDNCYVKIERSSPARRKNTEQLNVPVNKVIKISGIRFNRTGDGFFVTLHPPPVSIISDPSPGAVFSFMKRLEDLHKVKCSIGLLSQDEIRKYIDTGEEKILIAERDNSIVLLFCSASGFRENPVSEKILTRFKYEVFIPLKLIIL